MILKWVMIRIFLVIVRLIILDWVLVLGFVGNDWVCEWVMIMLFDTSFVGFFGRANF